MKTFWFKQESKTKLSLPDRHIHLLATEGFQMEVVVYPRVTEIRSTPGLKFIFYLLSYILQSS